MLTVLKIKWVCAFDEKAIWWSAALTNYRFDELPLSNSSICFDLNFSVINEMKRNE